MTVLSVNNILPDANGNVELELLEGPMGPQGPKGDRGLQGSRGVVFTNTAILPKVHIEKVTTQNGEFSVDISAHNFREILNVQVTLEDVNFNQADRPLGCHITSASLLEVTGRAFKVTSAGLLTAMQQLNASDGTIVHIMVMGI